MGTVIISFLLLIALLWNTWEFMTNVERLNFIKLIAPWVPTPVRFSNWFSTLVINLCLAIQKEEELT